MASRGVRDAGEGEVSAITWGEFKRDVEDQGVTDDVQIAWIDTAGLDGRPTVSFAPDGKIEIT